VTLGREVGTASLLTHLTALAEVTPTAPALVAADRAPLLFGALVDDLTAIGRELAALGYGDDTCIATLAPPGPETAVALLAISGAATCAPLDPRLTRGECEEVLRHTGATALAGPRRWTRRRGRWRTSSTYRSCAGRRTAPRPVGCVSKATVPVRGHGSSTRTQAAC